MRHLIQPAVLAALLAAVPATWAAPTATPGAGPAPAASATPGTSPAPAASAAPASATPAAAPASRAAARPAARPVTDRELGLSKTSVFDVPSPPAYHAEESAPGDRPLPSRANREAPPVVPHATADFLPITPTQNACADCHVVAGPKQKGEPTPVPPSHFVDQRHAPGKPGQALAGARWVCVSCHVGRTDAPPAVGSTFRP